MNRPSVLVAVVGTATEIGKTHTTAAVVAELRQRGLAAVARKPAQSFDPESAEPTDAEVLGRAADESPDAVCPPHRSYPVPMAPPMAADALGLETPTLADLVGEITWPSEVDIGFVEAVGGVRSPVADDGDSCALVAAIDADVVLLVADAGLGTIDSVRLAVDALGDRRVLVFLNRHDGANDLHRRNHAWLIERDDLRVWIDLVDLADALVE